MLFWYKKIWRKPIFTGGDPQLSSAMSSLTSVFGMGTGGTSHSYSPEIFNVLMHIEKYIEKYHQQYPIIYWLSPRPISTGHLNTLLYLQPQPIKHVCLHVVLLDWLNEISYLVVSFTLRCFQRLSNPNLATQLCHWYDNWCTICLSILVLSY